MNVSCAVSGMLKSLASRSCSLGFALVLFTGINANASVLLYETFSGYSNGILNSVPTASLNTTGSWLTASDQFGSFTIQNSRLNFARTNTGGTNVPKYARVEIANNAATIANSTEFWAYGAIDTGTTGGAFFSTSLFADATPLKPAPFANNLVFGAIGGKSFIATSSDRHSNSATSVGFNNQIFAANTLAAGAHTYLVRLVNQGTTNDLYQLWIDPDLSAGIAGLGAAHAEISVGNMIFEGGSHLYENTNYNLNGTDYSRSEVRYTFLANGGSSGWMDDFRMGTSFTDIVNVPEPGMAALAMVGLGCLVIRRKRRESPAVI